ncbi:MAG: hypothetical protein ACLU4S_02630 [Clostridium perfringens]
MNYLDGFEIDFSKIPKSRELSEEEKLNIDICSLLIYKNKIYGLQKNDELEYVISTVKEVLDFINSIPEKNNEVSKDEYNNLISTLNKALEKLDNLHSLDFDQYYLTGILTQGNAKFCTKCKAVKKGKEKELKELENKYFREVDSVISEIKSTFSNLSFNKEIHI